MKQRFNIKRGIRPNSTLEEIRWAEEHFGIKFINPEMFIILYDHIVWRPVMYETELAVARRERAPMITLMGDMHFVPLTWTHFRANNQR